MAKNIGNNEIAKEFWENLADASALSEETKAALRAIIGAGTGEGGEMTGAAIVEALDGYFGNTDWQTAVNGPNIIAALNSALGNSWILRAFERPPVWNIAYPVINSSQIPVAAYNGTVATITSSEWYFGRLPDGVTEVYLDECDFVWAGGESSWRFPSSTTLVSVVEASDGSLFEKLIESVVQNPLWSSYPLTRTLDCSQISVAWTFANGTVQNQIDTLLNAGWTIYTPEFNIVPAPWVAITISGVNDRVQPDGSTAIWIAQGDGGVTLAGSGLYYSNVDSFDPSDYTPVDYTAYLWPGRLEVVTGSGTFYATYDGTGYHVYVP